MKNIVEAAGYSSIEPVGKKFWSRKSTRKTGDCSKGILLSFFILLFMFGGITADPVHAAGRTVRVGVYQNEPKIYMDAGGHASGIYIDLLEKISAEAGWSLVYVPCEWAECLASLENGQIDLMPDVAYSTARAQIYDFNVTPVLESWSQVYAAPNVKVDGFNDLTGKRVAVLNGSIQQSEFEKYMRGFGFEVTIVPTVSLEEAFRLAGNGSADAAIANHFFGDYFYQQDGLVKTPIVFNPATLFYATAKGRNADLLETIDAHLNAWLQKPNSPYYTTLNRWTVKVPAPVYRVPQYIIWMVGSIAGLFILAAGMVLLLRRQVAGKDEASRRSQPGAARERKALPVDIDGGIRLHVFDPAGCGRRINPQLGSGCL